MSSFEPDVKDAVARVVAAIGHLRAGAARPVLVTIDGRSGTGKSTLATEVARRTGGVVVVGDDFYAGGNDDAWQAVTSQAKVEAVTDWRRLRRDVLEPLLAGRPASWHPLWFEAGVGWLGWKEETVHLEPAAVILLEGTYAARPELADLVDLAVLLVVPDDVRRARLRAREGEAFMHRWHALWDHAEDYYFSQVRPPQSFDLVLTLGAG